MRYLLTSAGIKNKSIHNALIDLLGKPLQEAHALCVPTASYAMRQGAQMAWRFISGREETPMCELGWKSLGVLELTALPGIDKNIWLPQLQQADALLVGGGDPMYLCTGCKNRGWQTFCPPSKAWFTWASAPAVW